MASLKSVPKTHTENPSYQRVETTLQAVVLTALKLEWFSNVSLALMDPRRQLCRMTVASGPRIIISKNK